MSEHVEIARFSREDLVPVPGRGPGVCEVCSGPSAGPRCPRCVAVVGTVSMSDAPVVPVTLARPRGAVAVALRTYKDSLEPHSRDTAARRVGWLVQRFMARHESCLAATVGAERFDVVVPVPEGSPRDASQPLAWLLAELPWARERVRMALRTAAELDTRHTFDPGRFTAEPRVLEGRDVLLVEDVWAGGSAAMSAVAAARLAGARSVVVLVIARLLLDDPLAPGAPLPMPPATAAQMSNFNPALCSRCAPSAIDSVVLRAQSL